MLVLASILACSEPKTETQKQTATVAQTPTIGYVEMTSFKLNKGVAEDDFFQNHPFQEKNHQSKILRNLLKDNTLRNFFNLN